MLLEHIEEYEIKAKIKRNPVKIALQRSQDVANFAKSIIGDDLEIAENFIIIMLNTSLNIISWKKISTGGTRETIVDLKLIGAYALKTLAQSVIFVHNHPGGKTIPSQSDINLTKKIENMLSFHDVIVNDHVIVTKDNHFSFADEGLL